MSDDDTRRKSHAWIEAGLAELASNGVGGVRVEVLAQRLGVTKGGFYRRFRDRRALLDAILDEWARGRIAAIDKLRERSAGEPPRARLMSLARLYSERVSMLGMAIELAVRQWARTDPAAAAACTKVDEGRLRVATGLYRELGFPAREARSRAVSFYALLFGQSLLFLDQTPGERARLTAAGADLLMAPASEQGGTRRAGQ